MDIYRFIDSKDVAAHCREIGKTWNTFEMAVIIGRSNKTTAERYEAWRELIDHYPDMQTPGNRHESIHKELAKHMVNEERKLAYFMTPQPGAVYRYDIWSDENDCWSRSTFQCVEDAIKAAKEMCDDEAAVIRVEKVYDIYVNYEPLSIIASLDSVGNIESLNFYALGSREERTKMFPAINPDIYFVDWGGFLCSDYTYVDIPTPFKRGDILTWGDHIFVLHSLDSDNPERLAKIVGLSNGYNYGTEGWGYFVNDNGCLYGDHISGNDAYEYYHGKLEGNNRLLHYVSLYYQDKIDLAALLNMQCRIILECQLSNNFNIDSHGCYVPVDLLAENRLTQDEKEELERTDGVMPWVVGKLTIHQVDFLVREYGGDRESVQLELKDYGGWCLGMCAGIVHDENYYEKTGDDKFNPARRDMARMFLAAYDCTEDGWIDKHTEPETGAEIDGVHIPMPDHSKLPTEED